MKRKDGMLWVKFFSVTLRRSRRWRKRGKGNDWVIGAEVENSIPFTWISSSRSSNSSFVTHDFLCASDRGAFTLMYVFRLAQQMSELNCARKSWSIQNRFNCLSETLPNTWPLSLMQRLWEISERIIRRLLNSLNLLIERNVCENFV